MSKQNGYVARVLVVEDEPDLREAMVSYLNLEGFFTDPVDLEELQAVVRNVAGRIELCQSQSCTDWHLNAIDWSLTAPDGSAVKLTRSETLLLNALASSPGLTVPKDTLIGALGHHPGSYDPRRMEIMIRRLRNKVKTQSSIQLPLETDRGMGYAFAAQITLAQTNAS